jgi:DNA-binding NarL/FixJ family response regulator
MRSTKRVILADGSRLVREMLHRVIDKAENLQVVDELSNYEGLHASIKTFDPEWVIVSQPYSNPVRHWLDGCMADHPAVGFVFLSASENNIKMKWQRSVEKEYSDLSLKEFLHILEKDLQHT